MPVVAPLGQFAGVTGDAVVTAFQSACGLVNLVTPTAAVVMGALALGRIPYEKWLKFVWKPAAAFLLLTMLILVAAVILVIVMPGPSGPALTYSAGTAHRYGEKRSRRDAMNLRSIAPVLLLCLLLAGCGAAEREEETGALESAAGLTENQEDFLTVDGEAVPAWRYLYWLAMDCRRLEEQYAAADEPLDWDAALPGAGETPAGVAKAAALEDMVLCAVTERWGTRFGCALTPEERAAPDAVGQPMAHRGAGDSRCWRRLRR